MITADQAIWLGEKLEKGEKVGEAVKEFLERWGVAPGWADIISNIATLFAGLEAAALIAAGEVAKQIAGEVYAPDPSVVLVFPSIHLPFIGDTHIPYAPPVPIAAVGGRGPGFENSIAAVWQAKGCAGIGGP